jgi:hypothetical protein
MKIMIDVASDLDSIVQTPIAIASDLDSIVQTPIAIAMGASPLASGVMIARAKEMNHLRSNNIGEMIFYLLLIK